MRKADLYDAVYKADLIAHWHIIRKWASVRYDIPPGDLDLLLELHKVGRKRYFTRQDFRDGTIGMKWSTNRWNRMYNSQGTGRIVLAKPRGKNSKYNGYKLSYETNKMISDLYKYLAGEMRLPNMDRFTGKYSTNKLQKKILKTGL